ncbi:glutaredoxin 2 [Aliamphritea ceti]|uniref:glutaredoxin 2 n=1 Tax=Aliamphritea ceti TaxID=1524258 RepID=UPI0021C2B025|nr:glutaredoxin 2 [Aliamphritea ceti]
MKLYAFNSCPFCIRVITLLGMKNIRCEISYVTLGNFPEHLQHKLSAATVPILEVTASDILLQDSGEIIRYLDQYDEQPLLNHSQQKNLQASDALSNWLISIRPDINLLCYPRMPTMNLPELASSEALARFSEMLSKRLGMSPSHALSLTPELLNRISEKLARLPDIISSPAFLQNQRALNFDDLCAFAELRNLTMVAELTLPEALSDYLKKMSRHSGVMLFSQSTTALAPANQ